MNNTKTVCDYYVLAKLGVDDDDVCSLEHFLSEELEAIQAVEKHGVPWLHDRERAGIVDWAKKLFDTRPEFYFCILEERSRLNFCVTELVYQSPPLKQQLLQIGKLSPEEKIKEYQQAVDGLILLDRAKANLEQRKSERDRKK